MKDTYSLYRFNLLFRVSILGRKRFSGKRIPGTHDLIHNNTKAKHIGLIIIRLKQVSTYVAMLTEKICRNFQG